MSLSQSFSEVYSLSQLWAYSNFFLYLAVFLTALYINLNFNTVMVGIIYLIPIIPMGLSAENEVRFLLVSFQNTMFGILEIVIFVITVRPGDTTFDKGHIKQLFGHVLPISVALIGLSLVARATEVPVGLGECALILSLFFLGSVMRAVAIYQIGQIAFKFDIVFRDRQKIKTDQLYRYMRHPSYTAMMIVIVAYAVTTTNLWIGAFGVLIGWFGFQYRIYFEEKALEDHFGIEYSSYKAKTGMWFPFRIPG